MNGGRAACAAWVLSVTAAFAAPTAPPAPAASDYATVTPGHPLVFPADYGSHPQFLTEWWYVTGWLTTEHGEPLGFQITFFRTKTGIGEDNPSSFAPRQLLIAHCAISDPKLGRLWQDQRIRRSGLGLAQAAAGDTDVSIDRWSLKHGEQIYTAKIDAEDFSFDLTLQETQALMLNGDAGVSRKGPSLESASYYYSMPHLRVAGTVKRRTDTERVTGEAWLDHEWSSEYLDAKAVGWDWIGINLDDGGALMAFRIRGPTGEPHWAGGTIRTRDGATQALQPQTVEFRAVQQWMSPSTGIAYPVRWQVRLGEREFLLQPLMENQENDARLSTGAIYWEGAVSAFEHGAAVGRGYVELTGYGEKLRLR